MNKKELEAFAIEFAKGIKTEKDLNEFSQTLAKVTIEAVLNAELHEHLGYSRYEQSENSNSRNGSMSKTLKTDKSQIKIDTPRDRDGSFEPRLVKKNQTRFHGVSDKVPYLYAKGMSTR